MANDAQRAKIFTKLAREITVVVKAGGPDPTTTQNLKILSQRRVLTICQTIILCGQLKAAGETGGDNYEDIVYEGYGPNGVAVIVETLTDNRNRTAADMRHYFDKFHGNLGRRAASALCSTGRVLSSLRQTVRTRMRS